MSLFQKYIFRNCPAATTKRAKFNILPTNESEREDHQKVVTVPAQLVETFLYNKWSKTVNIGQHK